MSSAVGVIKNINKGIRSYKIDVSNRAYRALIIAVFVGLFVLSYVMLSAYSASLQHNINVLQKQNECLEAEIDSLNSQIVEETKVTTVEKVATEKLGMVHPNSDNCITVKYNPDNNKKDNLAAAIKSEAYN